MNIIRNRNVEFVGTVCIIAIAVIFVAMILVRRVVPPMRIRSSSSSSSRSSGSRSTVVVLFIVTILQPLSTIVAMLLFVRTYDTIHRLDSRIG